MTDDRTLVESALDERLAGAGAASVPEDLVRLARRRRRRRAWTGVAIAVAVLAPGSAVLLASDRNDEGAAEVLLVDPPAPSELGLTVFDAGKVTRDGSVLAKLPATIHGPPLAVAGTFAYLVDRPGGGLTLMRQSGGTDQEVLPDPVTSVVADPQKGALIVGRLVGTRTRLESYDAASGALLHAAPTLLPGSVTVVASGGGSVLADGAGLVYTWNQLDSPREATGFSAAIALDHNGRQALLQRSAGCLQLTDVQKPRETGCGYVGGPATSFSPLGNVIASSGTADGRPVLQRQSASSQPMTTRPLTTTALAGTPRQVLWITDDEVAVVEDVPEGSVIEVCGAGPCRVAARSSGRGDGFAVVVTPPLLPPKPSYSPPAAEPVRPWPLGVFQDTEAPIPSSAFHGTNRWVGRVAGRYVVLYVGADGQDPTRGEVYRFRYSTVDGHFITAPPLVLPGRPRPLRIAGVVHSLVVLRSTTGQVLRYSPTQDLFV